MGNVGDEFPRWSMTARPFRVGAKDITGAWAVRAESIADAVTYVATQLEDQPERESLIIVVERTDR